MGQKRQTVMVSVLIQFSLFCRLCFTFSAVLDLAVCSLLVARWRSVLVALLFLLVALSSGCLLIGFALDYA